MNLAPILREKAQQVLGDKYWTTELVLRVGVELAQCANASRGLSGQQKCELVCQTILELLDDAEKAEKEHLKESTDSETSKVRWDECKRIVRDQLPVTLDLVVSAARGKFDLQKLSKQTWIFSLAASWCFGKQAVTAGQPAAESPAPPPESAKKEELSAAQPPKE